MTDPQTPFCETSSGTNIKLTAKIKAGGCAAKISAAQLRQIVTGLPELSSPALLTTIRSFEDAAVYKISDDLALVQTVDFFPPVVDDPFLFGRIAAVNALSDVYAMGGRPALALSVLCFPVCDYPLAVAQQILAGGAAVLKESGTALAGGHSIQSAEPIYGLAVTGFINPKQILTNGGGQKGDALVITKAIGTGCLLLADKAGEIAQDAQATLFESLTQLNAGALDVARSFDLHAATDITGFGLIGHAHEMAKASGLKCKLLAQKVPLLPQALPMAAQGLVPAGAYANRQSYEEISYINDDVDLAVSDLLFDPQTSGGLLFALPKAQAQKLCSQLHKSGLVGEIIGELCEGQPGQVEVFQQ